MNEIKGEFWDIYQNFEAIVCHTCNYKNKNKKLNMTGGIVRDFLDRFPFLASYFGNQITTMYDPKVLVYPYHKPIIFMFPTKLHFLHNSNFNIIAESTRQLVKLVNEMNIKTVLMLRPGCR